VTRDEEEARRDEAQRERRRLLFAPISRGILSEHHHGSLYSGSGGIGGPSDVVYDRYGHRAGRRRTIEPLRGH
jgi:hypothetical protein